MNKSKVQINTTTKTMTPAKPLIKTKFSIPDKYLKYLLITPIAIVLFLVAIYPFAYAIKLSLTNARVSNYLNPTFIGVENYVNLFTSTEFWGSFKVTMIYVGGALLGETLLGLSLAVVVYNYVRIGKKIIVSCLIIPMLVSTVLAGILFRLQLNQLYGVIPYYLSKIGFTEPLLSEKMALPTVILIDIWQWTSFVFLITYAGLYSLPGEPFEAARVDGASDWTIFKKITFPLVKPIFLLAIIFRTMDAFKAFDHIYMLTSGGPSNATMTLTLLTYDKVYKQDSYGVGAALSIIMLVIIILVSQRILGLLPRFKEKFEKLKVATHI